MKIPRRQRERLAKLMAMEQRGSGAEVERAREARARILARYGASVDDLEVRPRRVEGLYLPWEAGLILGAATFYRLPCRPGPMAVEVTCDAVMLEHLVRWAKGAQSFYQKYASICARLFTDAAGWRPLTRAWWAKEFDPVFDGVQEALEALERRSWGDLPLYQGVRELPSAIPGFEDWALIHVANQYEMALLRRPDGADRPWGLLTAEARSAAYALGPLLSHMLREGGQAFGESWFTKYRDAEEKKRRQRRAARDQEGEVSGGSEGSEGGTGGESTPPPDPPPAAPPDAEEGPVEAGESGWIRALIVLVATSKGAATLAVRGGHVAEPEGDAAEDLAPPEDTPSREPRLLTMDTLPWTDSVPPTLPPS